MTAAYWMVIAVVAMLVAIWALFWRWAQHEEEAAQRRRIKHHANGGSDVVAFRPIGQREKERGQ